MPASSNLAKLSLLLWAVLAGPVQAGPPGSGASRDPNRAAYFQAVQDQADLHRRMRQKVRPAPAAPSRRPPSLAPAVLGLASLLKPGLILFLLGTQPGLADAAAAPADQCSAPASIAVTRTDPRWAGVEAMAGWQPEGFPFGQAEAAPPVELMGKGECSQGDRSLIFGFRANSGLGPAKGFLTFADSVTGLTFSGTVRDMAVQALDAEGAPKVIVLTGDSSNHDDGTFRCTVRAADTDDAPVQLGLSVDGGLLTLEFPLTPIDSGYVVINDLLSSTAPAMPQEPEGGRP